MARTQSEKRQSFEVGNTCRRKTVMENKLWAGKQTGMISNVMNGQGYGKLKQCAEDQEN